MFENLRVGPQWMLSTEDIREIATAYDLRLTANTTQPLGGAVNGVVGVPTSVGPLVFRVHRPWTAPARLTAVHGVLHALRARGCPVPEIMRTHTDATWIWLGDRLVEVGAYVASDGPINTWDRGERAFAMLARLHTALDAVDSGAIPPAPYSSYASPSDALAMLAETEQIFAALRDEPGYAAAATARAETMALLQALARERQRYDNALTRGLTHGDYGQDNVLIRDDQIAAILDFDFLDTRERIYDLAYALYWMLARSGSAADSEQLAESDLLRAARLLHQYQEAASRPLSGAELLALPFEMARIPLYPIAEAGYTTSTHSPREPLDQTHRFARHLPVAQALFKDADRVHRVLTQAG